MQEKELSIVGKNVIRTGDLYNELKLLGIKKSDTICVHSHLMCFGKPLLKKQDFLNAIVETLFEVIGEHGTLIMPTFSYSFCKKEIFDVEKTPSDVGVLTDYFRTLDGVERTWHPIFSFAVLGERAEDYLDIGPDAFGLDNVYGKMIRDEGKIVMLGANKGYTFYYLSEEHLNVKHRFFKIFSGDIVTRERKYKTNVPYFARNLEIDSALDEEKLSEFLLDVKCQKQRNFANGTIASIDCRKMYYSVCDALRMNQERFLLRGTNSVNGYYSK